MHIAYYFEPWVELGRPFLRYHNLRYQLGPQIERLVDYRKGIRISIILGEGTYAKCLEDGYQIPGAEFCVVPSSELRTVFPNYEVAGNTLAAHSQSATQSEQMLALVRSALNGAQPDIFVSFLSPVPFVEALWPETLVLYAEFGLFSRIPYPRSFYFDPFGMFGKSYIGRFADQLGALQPTTGQQKALLGIRNAALERGIKRLMPKPTAWPDLGRHRKNILLPLQFSGYFGFDTCSSYVSQYDLLVDVLERVDPDVGVMVTEHNGWEPVITEHNEAFLRRRFPNLVVPREHRQYTNVSQFMLANCDAVASVSSSVALQAILWDKPVIPLGHSHLNTFSSGSLDQAQEVIQGYSSGRFDGALAHLIERYYPTERYAYDPAWSYSFYERALARHKDNTKDFDFFAPIDNPGKVYKNLNADLRVDQFGRQVTAETKIAVGLPDNLAGEPGLQAHAVTLAGYGYISFDVFDTLVQRPLIMPHQVFMLMQDEVREIVGDEHFEFHKLRRLAEHHCRTASSSDEVTLEEIYQTLAAEADLTPEHAAAIMKLELSLELRLCESRPSGKRLFELAKRLQKKIIIISDFYLGARDVEAILEACGYEGWHACFVSSEYRLSKKSGLLFGRVLKDLDIAAAQVLHIGDNLSSDVGNAFTHGIASLHTEKGSDLFFRNKTAAAIWAREQKRVNFPTDALHRTTAVTLGLQINRLYGAPEGKDLNSAFGASAEDFGYCVFGPIFLGFALNALGMARKQGVDCLFFLSRDGSILKKCYDIVARHDSASPSSRYVMTSRRALSVPAMTNEKEVYGALRVSFRAATVRHILEHKFGLNAALFDETCLEGADIGSLDDVIDPNSDMIKLRRVITNLMEPILANARSEREAASLYYQTTFGDHRNVALVDVGYTGSLQRYIRRLTGENPGCYFLLSHLKAKELQAEGVFVDGYLGNFIDHTETNNPFNSNITILESVCSSRETSVEKFAIEDGKAVPVLRKPTYTPGRRETVSRDIQKGVLDFAADFMARFGDDIDRFDFGPDFVGKWFISVVRTPSHRDALIFNAVEHEDLYSGYKQRFIIADVVGALKRNGGKLSVEAAREIVALSDWKQGARAILPPKTGTARAVPDEPSPIRFVLRDPNKPPTVRSAAKKPNDGVKPAATPKAASPVAVAAKAASPVAVAAKTVSPVAAAAKETLKAASPAAVPAREKPKLERADDTLVAKPKPQPKPKEISPSSRFAPLRWLKKLV